MNAIITKSNSKKRVAFIINSDTVGGHEFQAIEFILLSKKYCTPTVYVNSPEFIELFAKSGIEVILLSDYLFKKGSLISQIMFGIINYSRTRKLLSKYEKIIVSCGTLEAGIACGISLLGREPNIYVPMFVDRKNVWPIGGALYNFVSRALLLLFSSIITINRIQGKLLSYKKNIIILSNKTSIGIVQERKLNRRPRLYFVGRLCEQKRIPELLIWLDSEKSPYTEILLIGDGPSRSEVVTIANRMKHLKVTFTGWVDKNQQEELIEPSDILLLNSAWEGEPLVIREANERGNIVIARDIPGVRGCTLKNNRFKSARELHKLLIESYNGNLSRHRKINHSNIEARRESAAKKLFL